MDIARRVLNILALILLLAMGILLVAVSGLRPNAWQPLATICIFAGVPAVAHLISFLLSWGASHEQMNLSRAALGLVLSSISMFVWFVTYVAIVEGSFKAGIPSYGIVFYLLHVGMLVVLVSAVVNVAYFRSIVVTRPNYSLKRTAAGGLR